MNAVLTQIEKYGLIPIFAMENSQNAANVAEALIDRVYSKADAIRKTG